MPACPKVIVNYPAYCQITLPHLSPYLTDAGAEQAQRISNVQGVQEVLAPT